MIVEINGKPRELEADETVAGLLEQLGFEGRYALVERNGEPLDRRAYAETRLEDGDVLVIARPVAGG